MATAMSDPVPLFQSKLLLSQPPLLAYVELIPAVSCAQTCVFLISPSSCCTTTAVKVLGNGPSIAKGFGH